MLSGTGLYSLYNNTVRSIISQRAYRVALHFSIINFVLWKFILCFLQCTSERRMTLNETTADDSLPPQASPQIEAPVAALHCPHDTMIETTNSAQKDKHNNRFSVILRKKRQPRLGNISAFIT